MSKRIFTLVNTISLAAVTGGGAQADHNYSVCKALAAQPDNSPGARSKQGRLETCFIKFADDFRAGL